eukprot:7701214-Pyramimonas_sp.AAC.1
MVAGLEEARGDCCQARRREENYPALTWHRSSVSLPTLSSWGPWGTLRLRVRKKGVADRVDVPRYASAGEVAQWSRKGTRPNIPGGGTNHRGLESIFQRLEPITGD